MNVPDHKLDTLKNPTQCSGKLYDVWHRIHFQIILRIQNPRTQVTVKLYSNNEHSFVSCSLSFESRTYLILKVREDCYEAE